MFSKIKDITLQIVAGVNVATVAIMLLIGYSDRLNPVDHSFLANVGLAFPVFLLINCGFLAFFLFTRKKYALVSFLGLVAAYPPVRTYCPLNVPADVPSGSIKVLSYNVRNFAIDNGNKSENNPIVNYIVNSDADIVCLQEAWLEWFAEDAFKDVYEYRDSAIHEKQVNCLAILSRYPIIAKERIRYDSKSNLSMAFKVKIGDDTVTVVNNHFETSGLSLADRAGFKEMVKGNSGKDTIKAESKRLAYKLGESAKIRAPQVEAVAEYVKNCDTPVILCGDFNDSPISYTHRTLANVLTDCYTATGNGPGISYHNNAIMVRIDNIMCSDHWQPYGCKVDRHAKASDHFPIYCWLKLDKDNADDM